jgi:hypothetical protein
VQAKRAPYRPLAKTSTALNPKLADPLQHFSRQKIYKIDLSVAIEVAETARFS